MHVLCISYGFFGMYTCMYIYFFSSSNQAVQKFLTDQIIRLAKQIKAFSILKDCIQEGHTEPS